MLRHHDDAYEEKNIHNKNYGTYNGGFAFGWNASKYNG